MPLYEYRCKECGHRFEKIQSFSAQDVKECPVCQGAVERLISAPAVQFKGSGFYSTDYAPKPAANKGAKDGQASGEPASSPADGDSGAGAPAKPDSKADSPKAAPAASSKTE